MVQAFSVEPPGWANYVQLRMLTHYGSEPVCTLNDVCIHGKSAAEDLEDRLAMEVQALSEADFMTSDCGANGRLVLSG